MKVAVRNPGVYRPNRLPTGNDYGRTHPAQWYPLENVPRSGGSKESTGHESSTSASSENHNVDKFSRTMGNNMRTSTSVPTLKQLNRINDLPKLQVDNKLSGDTTSDEPTPHGTSPLRRENKRLKVELEQLQVSLIDSLKRSDRFISGGQFKGTSGSLLNKKMGQESPNGQMRSIKTDLRKLNKKNAGLKKKLSDTEMFLEENKRIELQRNVEKHELDDMVDVLNQKYDQQKIINMKIVGEKQRLEERVQNLENEKLELLENNDRKVADMAKEEGKTLTLKNKIEELERIKEVFVIKLQKTEDKASEAMKRANNQQAIAEDLMQKLKELERKYDRDMAEKSESLADDARRNTEKECAAAKLQMEAALAQLKLVKEENVGLFKKCAAAEKNANKLLKENNEFRERVDALQKKQNDSEGAEEARQQYEKRIREQDDELTILRERVIEYEKIKINLEQEQKKLQSELANLTEVSSLAHHRAQASEQERDRLQKLLEEAMEKIKEFEDNKKRDKDKMLNALSGMMDDKNIGMIFQAWRALVQKARAENNSSQTLGNMEKELEDERRKRERERDEFNAQMDAIDKKRKLEGEQSEKALQKRKQQFEKELAEAHKLIKEKNNMITKLTDEQRLQNRAIDDMNDHIEKLEKQIRKIKDDLMRTTELLAESDKSRKQLQYTLSQVEDEYAQRQKELEEKCATADEKLQRTDEKLREARRQALRSQLQKQLKLQILAPRVSVSVGGELTDAESAPSGDAIRKVMMQQVLPKFVQIIFSDDYDDPLAAEEIMSEMVTSIESKLHSVFGKTCFRTE